MLTTSGWADGGGTTLSNLTLLCSHHHRLLHEGGFGIGFDGDGTLYFRRADGRVIPRFGYRSSDMLDDDVDEQGHDRDAHPSAEVDGLCHTDGERGGRPSGEVRDTRPLYLVRRSAFDGGPLPNRLRRRAAIE